MTPAERMAEALCRKMVGTSREERMNTSMTSRYNDVSFGAESYDNGYDIFVIL